MGEETRIPIESRVIAEPGEAGPVGSDEPAAARRATSTRVIRQPRRPGRLAAAAVAVAALVTGGVGLALRDGGGSAEPDRDEPPPDAGTATADPRGVPAPQAYRRAALDLEEAGSFAYRGVVRTAEGNPFLPPGWAGGEVMVEGAAVLPNFAGRETAVDAAGRAFETVTTSGGAWSRAALRPDGLAEARWEQLRPPAALGFFPSPNVSRLLQTSASNRVGELGLTVALATRSAGERRGDRPDATGRRVVRATLPAHGLDEPWAAADVLLTLDGEDVAGIAVRSAPGRARFEVELDIVGIGRRQTVVPPEIAEVARSSVQLDALAAAGIHPVELGTLPSGWVLSQAWESSRTPECTELALGYADAVPDGSTPGWLGVTMTTERCAPVLNAVIVVSRPEPFAVGRFTGTIGEQGTETTGWLSDGVLAIAFVTDLSAEDATALLASLQPFDPGGEPTPGDAIPPS
ncbi:MAG: hypothetical protein ACRD07_14765 [Acidimicrobiales bacterium]